MMKHLGQFIVEFKNFLPKGENLRLHKLCKEHFEFNPAQVNDGEDKGRVDTNIRVTEMINLGNSLQEKSMTKVFWANYLSNRLTAAMTKYGSITNTDFSVHISDIQLLRYNNNGFYKTHIDDSKFTERRLSCVHLINDDYEGGELCFSTGEKGELFPIKVESNKLIVFPSSFLFPHGVQKVTKGIKYSMVSWAR